MTLVEDLSGLDSQEMSSEALAFVPSRLLALPQQLAALYSLVQGEQTRRTFAASVPDCAMLFIDLSNFSRLAASFTSADKLHAAEKLTTTLNGFLARLVGELHSRAAEVLVFAGDAVIAAVPAGEARSLREAAEAALEAALAVRSVRLEKDGTVCTAHVGLGVGELRVFGARGGERAAQLLFGGEAVRQVCDAARASKGGEVVLTAPAAALLPAAAFEPAGFSLLRLLSPAAPPVPPPRGGPRCGCGAPLADPAWAERALRGHAEALLPLAPPAAAFGGDAYGEIRPVFVVFASFPELDGLLLGGKADEAAERLGQVVRSLYRVAQEWGAAVNKVFLDEKGASAILAWGLSGGFAHEDDAERAVRAALALEEWFEEGGGPFACGVSGGRTFCGPLGAPCRKEFAIIGDAVILAARLMGAGRAAVSGGEGSGRRRQSVLCDKFVVDALAARGRRAAVPLDELPPVRVKGLDEPVPVFRPLRAPASVPVPAIPRVRSPPRSLRDLPAASSSAPPPPAAAARRPPVGCLGREAEVERALWAVAAAAAGGGCTLVLEGEAGHGKSLLMQEVQRECAARGFAMLRGGAEAVEESTPLWVLRGVLASLAPVATEREFVARLAAAAALPEPDAAFLWATLLAPAAKPREAGAKGRKSYVARRGSLEAPGLALVGVGLLTRVASCLARIVAALEAGGGRRRPVAVFLEDVHWLDSASWFVVRFLRDASPRLLLAMTARPIAEPPRDYLLLAGRLGESPTAAASSDDGVLETPGRTPDPPPAALAVWSLESEAEVLEGAEPKPPTPLPGPLEVVCVRLLPLARPAARELLGRLSERLAVAWSEEAVERVLDKAAGVPLYLVELVRQQAAVAAGGSPAPIPDSIQQIVLARVDQLTPAAREVVKLAAVVGTGFTFGAIRALAGAGCPEGELRAAFRDLARLRLVAEGGRVSVGSAATAAGPEADEDWPAPDAPFYFSHALVCDAVHSSLTRPHLRDVHRRFAAWLESQAAADPALLALHWQGGEDPERALHHLSRAAQAAREANALREAARLYGRLVALVDEAGLAGDPVPPVAGLVGPPPALPGAPSRAPPAPGERARWRGFRTVALRDWCYTEYFLGHAEAALDLCLAAIAAAGGEAPSRKLGLGRLLRMVARTLSLVRHKRPHKRGAVEAAAAGDGALCSPAEYEQVALQEIYLLVGWVAMKTSTGQEGAGSSALALTMSAAIIGMESARNNAFEHWEEGRGTAWFSVLLFFMKLDKAWRAMLQRANEIAERQDSDDAREACATVAAYIACTQGRFGEAVPHFDRARELAERASSPLLVDGGTYCAYVRLLVGRPAEAEEQARRLEAFLRRTGGDEYAREIVGMVCGYAAVLTGRDAEAGRLLARLDARPAAASFWTATAAGVLRGLLAWRRGETRAMAEASAAMERLLRRDPESVLWIHALPLACVLDFVLWRAADLRRRAGPPAPRRLLCGGAPRVADPAADAARAELPAAEAMLRSVVELSGALHRKLLPFLGPFVALARAEAPGVRPQRRLALLRDACAGLERSALGAFHAVALLRLSRAHAAAGEAAAAAGALAAACGVADGAGLRVPALERARAAKPPLELDGPPAYEYASLFV